MTTPNRSTHRSLLMGILNLTPDSYFDGGKHNTIEKAVARAEKLVAMGADILDIGGESTRPPVVYCPGQDPKTFQVSEDEESLRVFPLLERLKNKLPIPFSIDTQKPSIALRACQLGAWMINDIGGFRDPKMQEVAAETKVKLCVMHMQGTPATMQINPHYPDGVIPAIINFFEARIKELTSCGVNKDDIYLDPGIGFGKTIADNVEILQNLHNLRALGFPLLVGTSRKVFLAKMLGKTTAELLPATLAVNTKLIQQGVEILRVHDIAEHHDIRIVTESIQNEVNTR